MNKNKLAILKEEFDENWNENLAEFKAALKQAAAESIKAWAMIRKPVFELWAREGGEGLMAFAIAVMKGEDGREEVMRRNNGDFTTSNLGFNIGLIERDIFWATVNGFLAAGKIPAWILPIIAEILKQAQEVKK